MTERADWAVLQGDCLEVTRTWADGCVDLVVCSPPYEDARDYGMGFALRGQAWVDWSVARYLECLRLSKGLVAWVVEGRTKQFRWTATPALLMADLHRAGVKLRKPPIFARVGIMGGGGPDWWRNDYEMIVCASHGRLPWSNNLATGKPPTYNRGGEVSYRMKNGTRVNRVGGTHRRRFGPREHQKAFNVDIANPGNVLWPDPPRDVTLRCGKTGKERTQYYHPPEIANPGNVIKCAVGGGHMGSPLAHENEAPYPESLVEPFVLSFCPPGGVVLDPFCGSGTTLAVATRLGRRAVGIDVRPDQVKLTERRMKEQVKT